MLHSISANCRAPRCPSDRQQRAFAGPAASSGAPSRSSCAVHRLLAAAARDADASGPAEQHAHSLPSRQQLLRLVAAVAVQQLACSGQSLAEDASPRPLPKAYVLTISRLIKSLREALEAETGGAAEAEVRRKADPAKEQVREFVGKWRDNPAVVADASHDEIKAALLDLAGFYQKNGQRSRLSEDVRASVMQHLAAAEAVLPKQEEKVLGLF